MDYDLSQIWWLTRKHRKRPTSDAGEKRLRMTIIMFWSIQEADKGIDIDLDVSDIDMAFHIE
jgi:hypothetical protein